ncbi:MAG: HEAT repeat domain-containing protein, partial [Pirellulales bacterium]
RLAALEAWPANLEVLPSRAAAELTNDPDPNVRVALLDLLITRDSPQALPLVQRALLDHEWTVRARAIEGLGQIGGPVARQAALDLLQHRSEHVRAAAVAALHRADASADALAAVDDSSYRVRQAVAAMLPDKEPADAWRAVARRLVTDLHSEVALEVIGHLHDWPLEVACPMLLSAMGSTSYAVRKEATDGLGTRWEPASHFAYHAVPARRDEQLAQLRRAWASEPHAPGRSAGQITGSADHRAATNRGDAWRTGREAGGSSSRIGSNEAGGKRHVPVGVIEEVESRLSQLDQRTISQGMRRELEQSLIEMGPQLIDALTVLRANSDRLLPAGVYRRVLPAIDPAFDALAELASSDVEERRQAVEALAAHPRQTSLGQLALERLETLIRLDNDPIVWRGVQRIVADDDRQAAMQIELVALTHPVAEIRRRACEYFATHGDSRHVAPLVGSLEDTSQSVVVAACAALAEIGTLRDPLPLTRLLASSDVYIRLAAARALTRLGYESGQAALERLARHGDPVIRRQVAQAMGLTGGRAAVGTLIRLLDDRMGVRRAALASLEQLVPADEWPFPKAANPGVEQRVRRWKSWSTRPQTRRPRVRG